MERFSFQISDDNRRRIEILQAFSVLGNGEKPTLQDLVNQSIELFYVVAYQNYSSSETKSELLSDVMKSALPEEVTDLHTE